MDRISPSVVIRHVLGATAEFNRRSRWETTPGRSPNQRDDRSRIALRAAVTRGWSSGSASAQSSVKLR